MAMPAPRPPARPATLSTARWRKTLPLLGVLAVAFLGLAAGAAAQEFRVLYTFSALDGNGHNSDGAASLAPLLLGMDGNFYGTASQGGSNGTGTIFQLTPAGVLTTLYTFSALSGGTNGDGANPAAGLLQDGGGNFYGTAQNGGDGGMGTVFEYTADGQFITLYSFSGGDGGYPMGALIFDRYGDLYGTTSGGGTNGAGTIFTIPYDPDGFEFYSLYSLNGTSDGINPAAALLQTSDGTFYGTAQYGGAYDHGTVFKFTYNGTFTTLHPFAGYEDGSNPQAPLIQGSDGNFYGTTTGTPDANGDNDNPGSIFQMTPAGQLQTLFDFIPLLRAAGLIQGSDDRLFGGGAELPGGYSSGSRVPYGFLFQLSLARGGAYQESHDFSALNGNGDNSDGANPFASLIEGYDGSFYGTTQEGGANGSGTIFELDLPPLLTCPTTAAVLQGQPFSFQITAADSPTSYGVTGLSDGLTFKRATGLISGTPTAAGTLHLTVSAANDVGAVSQGLTITVKAAPPAITSAKTASGAVGAAFSYQITATYSPTSYAASNLPPGLSVNTSTGLISGTPTKAGSYQVSVGASNAGGTGVATVTITIGGAPVITSATSASATQGQAFSYQITATNSPTSYSASGLPTGLSVNTTTGLVTGTPKNVGKATVTVSATNSTGTGTAKVTLTINPPPPVITSATTASATVGQAFSYQITASNSPTAYAATGLPDGLTGNGQTGLISGTPTSAGTYKISLFAKNGGGDGPTTTLTLTVNTAYPTITSATTASATEGQAFTYQITATSSPTSYAASGLPTGLSVNTSTGLISGTPRNVGKAAVTISATNAAGTGTAKVTLTIAAP